jgi:hypothetical protein
MSSELLHEAWGLLQLVMVGGIMGFIANRTLDPGLRARGLAAAVGLCGLYLAPLLVEAGWPWPTGPLIVGQPLLPALAVTLGITGTLKLLGLGLAGPRS